MEIPETEPTRILVLEGCPERRRGMAQLTERSIYAILVEVGIHCRITACDESSPGTSDRNRIPASN